MIESLYASGLLNTPLGFAAALALGFCFGAVLEQAGFGSSRRLAGVFYLKDMTVVKVMFTAVVTAMLGIVAAERLGLVRLEDLFLMPTFFGAHALGGAIFGVGFAMAGWCPGTAATGLASGRMDALVYLAGAVAGSIAFNEAYPSIQGVYAVGAQGVTTLSYTLGVPRESLVLYVAGGALALFWICELIERGPTFSRPGVSLLFLAEFSILLAGAALFVISLPEKTVAPAPAQAAQRAEPRAAPADEAGLLAAVQAGTDHMEPEELAARLMAGEPALQVVDIRSKAEFDAFHLRGAVQADLADLPRVVAGRPAGGLTVLYSNGMTHPAQARDALIRLGHERVYLLTDGLAGFFERCLKPASLRDAPVSAQQAATITAWREYFLPARPAAPATPALGSGLSLPGLAEPAWLADNLGRSGLKVIDLRPQPQYNSGHIPGSLSLQLESLRGNLEGVPSMLLPGALLAAHMGQMGITPRDLVVIASAESPHDATLAAMALERLGHRRYLILTGGMKAWTAAGLPLDTALPAVKATTYPVPQGPDGFTVDGRYVLAARQTPGTVIIDVRPTAYYTGAKSDEARPGHIPGAVNRPFTDDHAAGPGDAPVLRPVDELAKAYAALIPAKDTPVIVHCRTGHQASQTWWVLTRLLGYTNVKYYDAGWTEWAARPEWPAVVSNEERKP